MMDKLMTGAALAALVASTGGTVLADDYGPADPAWGDDNWTVAEWVIESTGGVCYVESAERDRINITDYRVYVGPENAYGWLHVGTTDIGFLPCLPLECPEPWVLVSTACTLHDPLAHVPDLGGHPDSSVPDRAAIVPGTLESIDVGPLVEPAIQAATS